MADRCCSVPRSSAAADPLTRRVLWIALIVNVAMFFVEVAASSMSGSLSLLADSIDFFGDAMNYLLSLAVLGLAFSIRTRVATFKALCMGAFGVFVIAKALWNLKAGAAPEAATMGAVGALALLANAGVAGMLYRFRGGDADLRSVWICSRNDAIGNLAVLVAALGVLGTTRAWPDLLVAAIMGTLALGGCATVLQHARRERVL